MTMTYTTIDDVLRDARTIRDDLASAGETDASRELSEVVDHQWTFGSEALMEIGLALKQARVAVVDALPKSSVDQMDSLIAGTKKLFEG